jgi:hypothetical protein
MMNDGSRGPGRWQALLLPPAPTTNTRRDPRQALPLRDRLGSSAVNTYLKLLSAVALSCNFVVIMSVPVSAVAERVTHAVSPFRKITRRDQVIEERVGEL